MQVNRQAFEVLEAFGRESLQTEQTGKAGSAAGSRFAARRAGDEADAVQQSSLVKLALSAGSADRARRMEHLRRLVEAGAYEPDPSILSRAITSEMLAAEEG